MAVGAGGKDSNKQTHEVNGTATNPSIQTAQENTTDLNQYVVEALDQIFSNAEQNCEELFNSVSSNEKEQRNGALAHSPVNSTTSANQQGPSGLAQSSPVNDVSQEELLTGCEDEMDWDTHPGEEIGPGTTTEPVLMRTLSSDADGKLAKLDNFMDDEGDLSEDEDASAVTDIPVQSELQQQSSNANIDNVDQRSEDITTSNTSYSSLQDPGNFDNLPGEVIEETKDARSSSTFQPTVRQLNITTTIKTSEEINVTQQGDNVVLPDACASCEVQPFSLDDDFDYDVVSLTPKFDFLQKNIT